MQETSKIANSVLSNAASTNSPNSNANGPQTMRGSSVSSKAPQQLSERTIAHLRQWMTENYGHAWTSLHGEGPRGGSALTWALGLGDLTVDQLKRGLAACRHSTSVFPPNLPQFRQFCMGIPSMARVEREIRDGDRSPFTCMVLARLDGHRYRQAGGKDAERMLRSAYGLAVEDRMAGAPLPEPRLALPEIVKTEPKPADPETVKAHLAEIGEYLGVSK